MRNTLLGVRETSIFIENRRRLIANVSEAVILEILPHADDLYAIGDQNIYLRA